MKLFKLLTADQIECRISTISAKGCSLLLYKTARTDADMLDDIIGVSMWQNDFKLIDGVLYGGIGIYCESQKEWVWKWDAGTESNTEAEKGRASDAMKRAGFKWGIGRELYSAPFIWVSADKCKIEANDRGGFKCNDKFIVSSISYDSHEHINGLTIVNTKTGMTAFEMGSYYNAPDTDAEPKVEYKCSDCGSTINQITKRDGSLWHPIEISAYSTKRFGRCLCPECQKIAFAKEKEK